MWINTNTLEEYKLHSDIRASLPNVSLPNVLTDEVLSTVGIVRLSSVEPPAVTDLEVAIRDGVLVDSNGDYHAKWKVSDMFYGYINDQGILVTKTEQETEHLTKLFNEKAAAITKLITDSAAERLDTFAQTRNYDSMLSACTYATSQIPQFAKEGQYCVNMRDATWAKLYQVIQEVRSGIRQIPESYADVAPELPELNWDDIV